MNIITNRPNKLLPGLQAICMAFAFAAAASDSAERDEVVDARLPCAITEYCGFIYPGGTSDPFILMHGVRSHETVQRWPGLQSVKQQEERVTSMDAGSRGTENLTHACAMHQEWPPCDRYAPVTMGGYRRRAPPVLLLLCVAVTAFGSKRGQEACGVGAPGSHPMKRWHFVVLLTFLVRWTTVYQKCCWEAHDETEERVTITSSVCRAPATT